MSPILEDFNDIGAGCIKKKVTPLIKANGQTSILVHSKKENIVLALQFENYELRRSAPIITIGGIRCLGFKPHACFQESPQRGPLLSLKMWLKW